MGGCISPVLSCLANVHGGICMTYKSVMAVRLLENARRYLLRTYGRIDINEPDLLLDAVRDDGMMMVTASDTIDAEEVLFDCMDKILNPKQRPFHWWR